MRVSLTEFEGWQEFYRLHPWDDASRYHRPAAAIAATMAGGQKTFDMVMDLLDPSRAVERLEQEAQDYAGYTPVQIATMKALGGVPPRKG